MVPGGFGSGLFYSARSMALSGKVPWRVLAADDHPLVRLGVRMLLDAEPDFTLIGEASDGEMTVRLVRELQPDLLLLDIDMPRLPGLDALRALTESTLRLRTLLLTGSVSSKEILEALQLGASGVILKQDVSESLVTALRTVMEGRYWLKGRAVPNLVHAVRQLMVHEPPPKKFSLTPRELQMVTAVVEGCSNRDIAQRHAISEETVKRHLTNIFDKTGVSSRLELGMFAVHHHLVDEDDPSK